MEEEEALRKKQKRDHRKQQKKDKKKKVNNINYFVLKNGQIKDLKVLIIIYAICM